MPKNQRIYIFVSKTFVLLSAVHCYELTPWSRFPLEKLRVTQLFKKFPEFYRIQRLITVFTRACHWSLSWARWIQSTNSQIIPHISIQMLSFHLRLNLASDLFHSGFSTSMHFSYLLCVLQTLPSHLPWFDHLITLVEAYKLRSSSLRSL
jgi:hypothetical protein